MFLPPDAKEKLLNLIADQIPHELKNGSIKEDDLPEIAGFVLKRIDVVHKREELVKVLAEFFHKWPAFSKMQVSKI